ncbi:NmrA family NAD(P)-binding protein [Streptomyces cinnabarinus]|uniref:NmrA family NAD(P)-binding protein n=1 Tax=Streptomyces cinnabarinus TaxID=67287 RepID=A0ABY7KDD1_9ACTN|nr:NmrA family NAD(P)-binding protein [Streptomyces cinnabarinus]WAZ21558.1 NmrA family NAD(P)-binding protein [Streptomyces cinnabarinus]
MILVTGVSGGLGRLVLQGLSALSAPGGAEVVAGTRGGDGATARRIDFDDPGSLAEGLTGVDVLVMISAGYAEDDIVLARHGAVADAAAAAGVRHVIYTSLAASGERTTLALPHRWTENRLAQGPYDTTILRNGLYAELLGGLSTAAAGPAAGTGVFSAAYGTGRMSVVAREDLADITVRVAAEADGALTSGGRSRHAGRTYELEGVTALGGADLADLLTERYGRPVAYRPTSLTDARTALAGHGLEDYQITHTLSLLSNMAAGFLEAKVSDVPELLGRAEPRPVRDLVTESATAGG